MKLIKKEQMLIFFIINTILLALVIPSSWSEDEIYKFDRLWPTLKNAWHNNFFDIKEMISAEGFVQESDPGGDIAKDSNGYLYVADLFNDRIKKYSTDGQLVTMWGQHGNGIGQFDQPRGIAVDSRNCVYVTDSCNDRIQKFNSDGDFIMMWGKPGIGEGDFNYITGIAIDQYDHIYVANYYNNCIQKFDTNGELILEIKNHDSIKIINSPEDVAVDNMGHIYVTNTESAPSPIAKFTDEGLYVSAWSQWQISDFFPYTCLAILQKAYLYAIAGEYVYKFLLSGELESKRAVREITGEKKSNIVQIFIDEEDNIYLIDSGFDRIWKLAPDEHVIFTWGSSGNKSEDLHSPKGIDIDSKGFVYVCDSKNDRIQKFTQDGQWILSWGQSGSGEGDFDSPYCLAISKSDIVYVGDQYNHRIQKFTSSGEYIDAWGEYGWGNGSFDELSGIAIDDNDNIYIVDSNRVVQKFTSDGTFLLQWGGRGYNNGKFSWIDGIDTDSEGNVYVSDQYDRIQKFDPSGQFLNTWGYSGNAKGDFYWPAGVHIDKNDHVWVVDRYNHRIQKFDSQGNYITSFGEFGTNPGQLRIPKDICVDSTGRVYVTDTTNNRIQVFDKRDNIQGQSKAIILAGGGKSRANGIWDDTQICANAAYDALIHKGFSKYDILYLSPNITLDLDSNNEADDVKDATYDNLKNAIKIWAADAEFVVIYLVDHGTEGFMRINETQKVSMLDLDTWMDHIQSGKTDKIVFIYDACKSGSFLPGLKPPSGKKRIVITSTDHNENAHFVSKGTVSFSLYFWNQILNGSTVYDAFNIASQAMAYPYLYQTGQIDDNGDGIFNEMDGNLARLTDIGQNETVVPGDFPVISSVSTPQFLTNTATAYISAISVTDDDGIERVWATIIPPVYEPSSIQNPIKQLPSIELYSNNSQTYTGVYDNFHIKGTYQIVVYARDTQNHTSIPKITHVTIDLPIRKRAIVILGAETTGIHWSALNEMGKHAIAALKFQGYTDDDIYYLSPLQDSISWDGKPTTNNCKYAINTWADNENTHDLVLYMTGQGDTESFKLGGEDSLSFDQLSQWLDQLQETIEGPVTIIYDACYAGNYINYLKPVSGKKRIVIAGSDKDQPFCLLYNGRLSFSGFFWEGIQNGFNVEQTLFNVVNSLFFLKINQTPVIDDNGNGIGNEKTDRVLAQSVVIGTGIQIGNEIPVIDHINISQSDITPSTIEIKVNNVSENGNIVEIFAFVKYPDEQHIQPECFMKVHPTINFHFNSETNTYEGLLTDLSLSGEYEIIIYSRDIDGNFSSPTNQRFTYFSKDDWDGDRKCSISDLMTGLKLLSGNDLYINQAKESNKLFFHNKIDMENLIRMIKYLSF
ncbi:Peptidase C13, legumain [Candidatus Magnetomorum sp. HK-1]|nr:Peptidase C13, legumain [Candidatus Magnetomorum sp. HK-1]